MAARRLILKMIEQKGMTFDHDLAILSSFLNTSFFMRKEKMGKE